MSQFASITADILARKGEARPWNGIGADIGKAPIAWEAPPKIQHTFAEPPTSPAGGPPVCEPLVCEPPPKVQHRFAEPLALPPKISHAFVAPVVPEGPAGDLRKRAVKISHPAAPDAAGLDMRKYTIKISHHDYERLGILAVKQGKSRQRLLQETVNTLFTGMTEEFGASCQCLGKGG